MKRTILFISVAIVSLTLPACKSPEDTARLGKLVNLAITTAEKRGTISPADAQAIRDAKTIVLPEQVIETTSGK